MFKADNSINLLIGKDIARTAGVQVTDEATVATYIADGEVVILDELFQPLAPGTTFTGSQKINIVQGRGLNGKGLKTAFEIDGRNLISAKALSFRPSAEQTTFIGNDGVSLTDAIVVSPFTDYKLTVLYKQDTDLYAEQHAPRTYYYTTGAADTQLTIATAFVTMINAEAFYNATASVVTLGANSGIQLTGRILSFEVGLEKYNKMDFEVLTGSGFGLTPVTTTVGADLGSGEGEQIAEMEWFVNGFDGVINRVHFPAPKGTSDADLALSYDLIALEFMNTSEDYPVSGTKGAKCLVYIALPDTAAQTTDFLAQLNPWIATTVRPFAALTV